MSFNSEVGGTLRIFKATGDKVIVTMKSKRIQSFIAIVAGFKFDGEEDNVIFKRCPETIFPDETEDNKSETYTTYIKNVKDADLVEP